MKEDFKLTRESFERGKRQHEKIINHVKNKHYKEYERERFLVELGELLAELRKEQELTQKKLAERIKTKQAEITRIERGRQNISVMKLYDFAMACGKRIKIEIEPIHSS